MIMTKTKAVFASVLFGAALVASAIPLSQYGASSPSSNKSARFSTNQLDTSGGVVNLSADESSADSAKNSSVILSLDEASQVDAEAESEAFAHTGHNTLAAAKMADDRASAAKTETASSKPQARKAISAATDASLMAPEPSRFVSPDSLAQFEQSAAALFASKKSITGNGSDLVGSEGTGSQGAGKDGTGNETAGAGDLADNTEPSPGVVIGELIEETLGSNGSNNNGGDSDTAGVTKPGVGDGEFQEPVIDENLIVAVSEPSSLILFLLGIGIMVFGRLRRPARI